jgi:hypothetical protein
MIRREVSPGTALAARWAADDTTPDAPMVQRQVICTTLPFTDQ